MDNHSKNVFKVFSVLLFLAVLGVAAYWYANRRPSETKPAAPVQTTPPQPSPSPLTHYPAPDESQIPAQNRVAAPVPPIDESDPTLEKALYGLFGKAKLEKLLNLNEIARRFVVTCVSAAKGEAVNEEFALLKPLDTEFRTERQGLVEIISRDNYRRYTPYVDLLKKVDARKLVSVYAHFYRLFQDADHELGKNESFHDRLIQAIDIALSTPEVPEPIQVIQPDVRYRHKFVDERLEGLPFIQKALLRMGPQNSAAVKAKLRQIRAHLLQIK